MSGIEDPSLNHTASSVVGIVKENPGIHFRELARAANISSMGQLRHHVDRLRQRGVLIEVQDGRYKRFFVTGTHPPAVRKTLARFSRPVPLRIAKLLLWRPMSRAELRRNLGCADSTLGYHLTRMSMHGDVVKTNNSNHSRYTLADPEGVRAALVLQRSPTMASGTQGSARGGQGDGLPATEPGSIHEGETFRAPGERSVLSDPPEEEHLESKTRVEEPRTADLLDASGPMVYEDTLGTDEVSYLYTAVERMSERRIAQAE